MSSIAHGMRKRLSVATTRTKTVEKKISAEYTTEKHALQRQKATLEKSLEALKKGHSSYRSLGDSYKAFAELVSNDAPADSPVYTAAATGTEAATSVHDKFAAAQDAEAAPARLEAHVRTYLAELTMVEKEFSAVESGFVEVSRYERKVNKLSEKKAKLEKAAANVTPTKKKSDGSTESPPSTPKSTPNKASERARRNLDKLEAERAAFQTKLQGVIDMMKKSNAKFEKALHCVHAAYWLAEDSFLKSADTLTKSVREKCVEAQEDLVKWDVTA